MSLFFASIRDNASRGYLRDENLAANLVGDIRQEYRSVQTGPTFNGGTFMKQIPMGRVFVVLLGAAVLAMVASSQEKKEGMEAHKIVHFGDLKWTPIIKGCDMAVVEGNPDAEGQQFVIRFRCTDGTKVPAHWHPTDEYLTVLKGAFLVGTGDTIEEAKLKTMNVGNFLLMPKEMYHFALNKGDTIVQVHGIGPFKVNWVNPSEVQQPDAPAAAAKPKP